MGWIYLALAGLCEIAWPLGLKLGDGFSRSTPIIGGAAAIAVSLALFALAVRTVPVGTAYAVWTGMGAAGTALLGMAFFHEPAAIARIACIVAIVAGVAGLKLVSVE